MASEYLDNIASALPRAEALNAIHACREGHPLGRDNNFKFRNAWAMVEQASYFERRAMDPAAVAWLRKEAQAEHEWAMEMCRQADLDMLENAR